MIDLIDSHCHLEKYVHAGILDNALNQAKENGIRRMIAVGTDFADWRVYHDLAIRYPGQIYYAIGIHPCYVDENWEAQSQIIAPFFTEAVPPIAIGEIGLDYYHLPANKAEHPMIIERQKTAFRVQLALALQLDMPIIVHSRNAFHDCVKIIDESGVDWKKVVFHCFVEGPEEVSILNARGGRASFTGVITYKNAEPVRQAALKQGLDWLMIETDAPYLTPMPHRGKENQPAYLKHVAEFAAELFGLDLEAFSKKVTENTEAFFGVKSVSILET